MTKYHFNEIISMIIDAETQSSYRVSMNNQKDGLEEAYKILNEIEQHLRITTKKSLENHKYPDGYSFKIVYLT